MRMEESSIHHRELSPSLPRAVQSNPYFSQHLSCCSLSRACMWIINKLFSCRHTLFPCALNWLTAENIWHFCCWQHREKVKTGGDFSAWFTLLKANRQREEAGKWQRLHGVLNDPFDIKNCSIHWIPSFVGGTINSSCVSFFNIFMMTVFLLRYSSSSKHTLFHLVASVNDEEEFTPSTTNGSWR